MQKINVILTKDVLDLQKAHGKVAVVLDIIFATTTIVAALQNGARAVLPALNQERAMELASGRDAAEVVLAGEYHADTLEGFHPYNPLHMQSGLLAGKDLIYSTTNGTVALCNAQACRYVYVGALLNARAVVQHLLQRFPQETILLVCAGSRGGFSLEDFFGAGYFVHLLLERCGAGQMSLSDTARAALGLFRSHDPCEILLSSKVGQRMAARSFQPDIEYAARLDACGIVPALVDGVVVSV